MIERATVPYIKYAGGKRDQIPRLREFWEPEQHRRLVDLTVGAAAIPLGLQPQRALLNDINPHLVNLHRQVQQGLDFHDFELENTQEGYLARRDRFNQLIATEHHQTREAAQLFYYLLRSCFNGLCRFSRNGFNVGWGKYKTTPGRYQLEFKEYQAAFEGWEFTCSDFADVPLEPDDFVFADPPYDSQDAPEQMSLLGIEHAGVSGRSFTSYNTDGFSWLDQVRLANRLAEHPGPVVAFNAATPRIVDLYKRLGFEIQLFEAKRRISCNGDRTPAQEMLAFKPAREESAVSVSRADMPYPQQYGLSQARIKSLQEQIEVCKQEIIEGREVEANQQTIEDLELEIEDEEFEFPHYFQPGDRVRVKETVANTTLHGKIGIVERINYKNRNAKGRPTVQVYFHPDKPRTFEDDDSLRFDPVLLELLISNPYKVGDAIVQDLNNPYWRKQGHIVESSIASGTILEFRPTHSFGESQYPWIKWEDGTEGLGIIVCFRSMRNGRLIEFEDEIAAAISRREKERELSALTEKTDFVKSPEPTAQTEQQPVVLPEAFAPRQSISQREGTKWQLIHAAVKSRYQDTFSSGLAEADLYTIEQVIASPELQQQGKAKLKKLEKRRAELLAVVEQYKVESKDWLGILTQDYQHGIHLRFVAPFGSEWHYHIIDSESISEVVTYFYDRMNRHHSGAELFVGSKDSNITVWLKGKPAASIDWIYPQEGDCVRLHKDMLPQSVEWPRGVIKGEVGEPVVCLWTGADQRYFNKRGAITEIRNNDISVTFDQAIDGHDGSTVTCVFDRSVLAHRLSYREINDDTVFKVVQVTNLATWLQFEGSEEFRIAPSAIKEIVQGGDR